MQQPTAYNDDDIKTLDWMEHIRRRPGMYIGKLGDGSYADDGIYVLLKEVLDNSIDEFAMGAGTEITINTTRQSSRRKPRSARRRRQTGRSPISSRTKRYSRIISIKTNISRVC